MEQPSLKDAVARIEKLPTLPTVLAQVMSAIEDPDSSALDLGRLISADQSLSTMLLRLVNSAYYGSYRQVDSVTQAIVMLGFMEVRNLALTATAFSTLGSASSAYDRAQLWRHSLATAIAAERCVRLLGWSSEGVYFVAGLLHDVGKVVMDALYPDLFREAARQANDEKCAIDVKEKKVIGFTHAELGGLLAEHWNLPESIATAIRYHHAPERSQRHVELVHLIAVANRLAYEAEMGEGSSGCLPEPPKAAAQLVRLTEAQRDHVRDHIRQARTRIESLLGALGGAA